jgi:thiamine-phosphate pyrophosphorylase
MMNTRQARQKAFLKIDLYPVTSQEFSLGRKSLDIVQAVVQAGCRIVQLREKGLTKRAFWELAKAVRKATSGVLMMVNDHLDVALATGADGVHLGGDDLPVAAARSLAPELLVGASCHDLNQAIEAQKDGADYVNIGPLFSTSTKQGAKDFVGIQAISEIGPHLSIPFTVMGGIKAGHIPELLRAGARRIAVVTAVTAQPDPCQAAMDLRKLIKTF